MNDTLVKMKQSYIEYALFHYHFKSRISVWLLNYLKASPIKLNCSHFVNKKIKSHITLEIGLKHSNFTAIKLTKDDQTLINTNEIFNYITSKDICIDIFIHFEYNDEQDWRLNELIIQQLIYSDQYLAYLNNIYHLSLDLNKKYSLIEQLEHHIDVSLQMKDQQRFYQLSQILSVLTHHS
ncbi:YpiB family protein [Staphylococcus hominis]|uniref:YpiB family protein n=1 Tax=Staphylococcus hominis TaxID=1290 RepID=UPI003017B2ED